MAISYAWGVEELSAGKPASAFSKGDILVYTSASSLSRMPEPAVVSLKIAGVALADSTQSVNNKVGYIKVNPNTVFWSDATPGSTFTRGAAINFNYGSTRGPVANSSTGTLFGTAEREITEIEGQSVQSRILFRFNSISSYIHG